MELRSGDIQETALRRPFYCSFQNMLFRQAHRCCFGSGFYFCQTDFRKALRGGDVCDRNYISLYQHNN